MTDCEALKVQLRRVPLFADLKDEDGVCMENVEERRLQTGEVLVKEGEPAENFFVLLEGEVSVAKQYGDQQVIVARYRPGAFFGEVPLLLGVPYILTGRAESDCRVIVFPEEGFWRLLRLCPSIAGEIFRAMALRLRNLEGSTRQHEKLAALGTMSAGLAHELNNPSAAAQRIAVHLGEVIQTIQVVSHRLHQTLEHEHWDRLIGFAGAALENLSASKQNHSIEQSDSEDVLGAWLREREVADAWKIAPVLVSAGVETERAGFAASRPSAECLRRCGEMDRLAADDSRIARRRRTIHRAHRGFGRCGAFQCAAGARGSRGHRCS